MEIITARAHSLATSLDESTSLQSEGDSNEDKDESEDLEEKILEQQLTSEQILRERGLQRSLVKPFSIIGSSKDRCIYNHLASKAMHEKLKEQIKDVDSVQSKEVPVFWVGMAEVNMQR